jgi:hypothetical protein
MVDSVFRESFESNLENIMKRLLLGLALIFFITSNAWSVNKMKFDSLKYQLGMTYDEVKERGKKDYFFFDNFSATSQSLTNASSDIWVSAKFCEGSNYDGKLFSIESGISYTKKESLDVLLIFREFVVEMTGGVEKVVKINKESEEDKDFPGIVVTHDLSNGETWKLTKQVSIDDEDRQFDRGYLVLIRENLSVCE